MRRLLAVLVVLVACGDDGNVNPLDDAPPAPDSPVDAPTTGLVTLTITLDGAPQVGIKVYFQNADSTLVSATMTDASGVASATMDTGGFVTAIDPFAIPATPTGGGTDLGAMKTFAGVKPNDNLVLKGINNPAQTNVTILAPEDPTASVYELFTNCGRHDMQPSAGSSAPAGGLMTLFGCGGTIDLVVETRDGNGVVKNALSKNGVTLTEGGTIDLTMVTETYLSAATTTWMYGNVPANLENVTVDGFLATSRGPSAALSTSAIVTSGSATTAPLAHSIATDSIQVNVSRFSGSGLISEHTFVEWGAPTAAYVLAMDNGTLMPDFTTAPLFDVNTRSVIFSAFGTNTRLPDLAIAHVEFGRGGTTWRWDFVAPHTTGTLALPSLPAPDSQLNAVAGDAISVDNLLTASVPGGYDTIRANALTFFDDPTHAAVVGATGQIALQELALAVGVSSKRTPRARLPSRTRR